jgi:hypothetical protein
MLGETKTYILGEADGAGGYNGVLGVLEVPVGGWFCYWVVLFGFWVVLFRYLEWRKKSRKRTGGVRRAYGGRCSASR